MPGPTLTAAEIAQLKKEAARQTNFAESLAAAVPAKAARAAELGVADGAFKKFFDYYNDDIIGRYDSERRALNGLYIVAPITEADVVGPANLNAGVRTTPTLPATDIIRVTQFDGGGTSTDPLNEVQHIADQLVVENHLTAGYSPQPTINATTKSDSALTGLSTTLDVEDNSTAITFTVGDYFVVKNTTTSALLKVVTATPGGAGPPYTYTLGIEVIIPPVGTIATNSDVILFNGFNNTERTNKVTTNVYMQNIMDFLIADLEAKINLRIARLNTQITAINGNQDPDAVAQLATALTNVNTSKTFLTNYLLTTIISNTGLGTLATERGVRGGQITTRLSQIAANYTGQTENYYNRRYQIANDRANTSRGTLRLQVATAASSATLTSYAASATAAADAINNLLS